MTRLLLVLAALAMLASGCGGDADDSDLVVGSDVTPAAGDGRTALDLATEIGCVEPDGDERKVSCEANDTFYGVTVYDTEEARDADVETASAVTTVLVGDFWMIDAPSAADLEAAKAIVGGELVAP